MAKNSRLGRGLSELLAVNLEQLPVETEETDVAVKKGGEKDRAQDSLKTVPIEKISPGPFQPRHHITHDGVEQLSESIKAQGVLQPILVRSKSNGLYEIVAGERRWRAAQLAGVHNIPVIVKDMSDQTAYAVALIENIQRENLNPIEEAKGLKRLADEINLTHLQVAEAVGKSRTSVTNLLRLLTLNEDVQEYLEQDKLNMGHARALLGLKGPIQSQVAKTVVIRGMSVRETERLVGKLQQGSSDKKAPEGGGDPNINRLQQDLSEKLGAAVRINHSPRNGQGMLVIKYNDVDQLEGILSHFK